MSHLQLDRGNRESQDLYIGLPGEITVDTSNQDIRLHDGVTPGGRIIGNRDNNDQRYQARSPELDGLLDFEPQNRGILVRRGPADYRLRKLTAAPESINITNGDGYAGQPTVALAGTITSDHTFSGTVTFGEQIIANGGIKGALEGNVTGNVTGNVVGNLEGNSHGNATGTFTGDVDTRAGTLLLGASQVHLAAFNADATDYIQAAGVPKGSIIMWHGSVPTIPAGWFLCDGANGTPDLRERFVIGVNPADNLDPGDVGGNGVVTPTAHVDNSGAHSHALLIDGHALTVDEMPSHNHKNGVADNNANEIYVYGSTTLDGASGTYGINSKRGENWIAQGLTSETGADSPHSHTGTTENGGQHSHVVTVDQFEILPPYMALCFIMKGL